MSKSLFGELAFQLLVAAHQVFDDNHHLNNELPLLVFLFSGLLNPIRILVKAFFAVSLCPCQSLLEFFFIIDAFCHPADDFHFIYRLDSHSQIGLDEIRINDGAADTHADRTDLKIGFTPHGCDCNGRTSKSQQHVFYICRDLTVVRFLNVMTINAEGRKTLLRMSGQNRCQIYGARSLSSVQAPHALDGLRVHIHGLRSIAPAGSNRQSNVHSLFSELLCTRCALSHPSDSRVSNNNLYRLAVGIFQVLSE